MRHALPALIVAALALPAAAGDVHMVPQEHATIQGAVDAAADGDTILISHGTYAELVEVTGKHDLLILCKGKVVIDPSGGVGLKLNNCNNCRVEKLRVSGGEPFGIQILDGHDNTLSKCRVTDAAQDGIRLDGGNNQIVEKCTVVGGVGAGISISGGGAEASNDCTISKCKLDHPGTDGVVVHGSNNTVEKCKVLHAGEDGFEVDATSLGTHDEFDDCTALQPVGRGLVVTGDDHVFFRCKVVKAGAAAADVVSGIDATLTKCKLVHPATNGLLIEAAATTTQVIGCTIPHAGEDGIRIAGDNVALQKCKVSAAAGCGFRTVADNGSFTGNKASGSGASGFWLELGSAGNVLTKNKASGSADFDLFDDSKDATNNYDQGNKFKTIGITQ